MRASSAEKSTTRIGRRGRAALPERVVLADDEPLDPRPEGCTHRRTKWRKPGCPSAAKPWWCSRPDEREDEQEERRGRSSRGTRGRGARRPSARGKDGPTGRGAGRTAASPRTRPKGSATAHVAAGRWRRARTAKVSATIAASVDATATHAAAPAPRHRGGHLGGGEEGEGRRAAGSPRCPSGEAQGDPEAQPAARLLVGVGATRAGRSRRPARCGCRAGRPRRRRRSRAGSSPRRAARSGARRRSGRGSAGERSERWHASSELRPRLVRLAEGERRVGRHEQDPALPGPRRGARAKKTRCRKSAFRSWRSTPQRSRPGASGSAQ